MPADRLALLDTFRGFAVLAILLVNYDFGLIYFDIFPASGLDRLTHWLVDVLGRDKFWPVFALLFGVGFGVQQERAKSRGVSVVPTYLRRLIFLTVIGCLLLLVIDVAILLFLAIAGVPLLLIGHFLRRFSPRAILAAALIALAAHQALSISDNLRRNGGVSGPPEVSAEEVATRVDEFRGTLDAGAQRSIGWNLDQLGTRAWNMLTYYVALPRILWEQRGKAIWADLQFMLVGLFLWRIGIFSGERERSALFRRMLGLSLPVGLAASIYVHQVDHDWALTQVGMGSYPSQTVRVIFSQAHTAAAFGMGLAYLSGIALLLGSPIAGTVQSVFAPVGRTALTNYALQALFPALLFGYHLPGVQKETLGHLLCIGVLLLVFSLQVLLSRAWVNAYRFGPLEWVWRSLTYLRFQPMRVT